MYCLGFEYKNGNNGFEKNNKKSFAWFMESGNCFYSKGFLEVAKFLILGSENDEIPKNLNLAKYFLEKIKKGEFEDEKNQILREIEK